jgi:hypothetical protein
MVIDFQHHYIPVELAKKRGLYSATGKTMLQESGLPATTMHQRLNCALQGIRPERLVFASDYPQDFTGVNTDTGKGMSELKNYIDAVRRLPLDGPSHEKILGGTAAELLKLV